MKWKVQNCFAKMEAFNELDFKIQRMKGNTFQTRELISPWVQLWSHSLDLSV